MNAVHLMRSARGRLLDEWYRTDALAASTMQRHGDDIVNTDNSAIMTYDAPNETATWLLDLPPTPQQSRWALAGAAVLLLGFALFAPFAATPLPQVDGFIPALDIAIFVTNFITAALLLAQFSVTRSTALVALASGYIFTALIAVAHALSFPGAFSQTGNFGANQQTTIRLYLFWHFGLPAALFAYVWLKDERRPKPSARVPAARVIICSVVGVLVLTGCVVWLAATGDKLLPSVWVDPHHGGLLVLWILALVMLINATALSALWILRRSVIDEWLMVVVLASMVELAITALLGGTIFTLGFYSGRIFSLVTSTVILAALLVETTKLYARLARSNSMLQAERLNKLMNLRAAVASIRHEIRNPLQAVTANCQAALRCLKSGPPDLEEAQLALGDAIGDSFRIAEVFRNIGDLFDKDEPVQHPTDANETIFGALRLVHGRLNDRGVIARVELASDLPLVSGHKGQLQEVIINLLLNAVEAMEANREDGRQLTVRTKRHDGESISIEVQDTGLGIDPEDYNRIFEAFVTTKPGGTGLGLAICRTIVERHRGQLSVSPVIPRGTVFRILLPKADTHHR